KVRRLLAYRDLCQENQWLRRELSRRDEPGQIVGHSLAMQRVFDMVRKVGPTRSTVLLVGESGTGKDLIARETHQLGEVQSAEREARTPRPSVSRFLPINCAAIPTELLENQLFGHRKGAFTGADRDQPGVFVHAGAGTVFLDEIGE